MKLNHFPFSYFSYCYTFRRNSNWVVLTGKERKDYKSQTQSPICYMSDLHHLIITQTLETMCVMVRHEPRGDPYVEQISLKVSSVTPADHTKPECALRWRRNKKPWIRLSLSSCVTSIQISAFSLGCVSAAID